MNVNISVKHATIKEIDNVKVTFMISVLTYNIHVGIEVSSMPNYCRNLWKHAMPSKCKNRALERIAALLCHYDIVALQEVDLGSLRSNFVNQAEELAKMSGHQFIYSRRNRDLRFFAQHGLAILSKYPIVRAINYPLPGMIPGRGVIECGIKTDMGVMNVVATHLALSTKDRTLQLRYLKLLVSTKDNFLIMGDFNCGAGEVCNGLQGLPINSGQLADMTYPSWKPRKQFDHIVCSSNFVADDPKAVMFHCSDHLPVETHVRQIN